MHAHLFVTVVAASIYPEELPLLITARISELSSIRVSSSTLLKIAYFQLRFPFVILLFSGGGVVVVGAAALGFPIRRRDEQRRARADEAEGSGHAREWE
jgi:hypothetical protein